MPTQTETKIKTIKRQITLCRNEQDVYTLQIELPEGVTVEQVDAELVDWQGKYATHCSDYSWGEKGPLNCGAVVTDIDESMDDCSELDCGPVVRDEALNLVPGSDEWPGHFDKRFHFQLFSTERELVRQALLNGTPDQQTLADRFKG